MVTIFPIAAATVEDVIPIQILAFGALMLAAHLGSKLFNRLNLPEPAGQLLGGMLVGPWFLRTIGSCLPYLVFPQAGVAAVEAAYRGHPAGAPYPGHSAALDQRLRDRRYADVGVLA